MFKKVLFQATSNVYYYKCSIHVHRVVLGAQFALALYALHLGRAWAYLRRAHVRQSSAHLGSRAHDVIRIIMYTYTHLEANARIVCLIQYRFDQSIQQMSSVLG
jgi:hypothetical protein